MIYKASDVDHPAMKAEDLSALGLHSSCKSHGLHLKRIEEDEKAEMKAEIVNEILHRRKKRNIDKEMMMAGGDPPHMEVGVTRFSDCCDQIWCNL